jgi:excisionase family DNA binding protein
MPQLHPNVSSPPALLTLEEAASAARTSPSTVRHWLAIGRLASVKPGRRRLIRRADLARLLEIEPHELSI